MGKKRRLSRRNLAILAVAEVRFALATEEEFGRSEVWLAICGRLLALLPVAMMAALLHRGDGLSLASGSTCSGGVQPLVRYAREVSKW